MMDERRLWRGALVVLALVVLITTITTIHKLRAGQGAFLRWRPLVEELVAGKNVYVDHEPGIEFGNPPALALVLYPLTRLPPITGALLWFFLKIGMAAVGVWWALSLCTGRGPPLSAAWAIAGIGLSLRPITSDLQHGNVNVLIFFLVMAAFRAFALGADLVAGALLGAATAFKLTPALLIVYFFYKRAWRVVGGALAGLIVIFAAVPVVFYGFDHAVWLLGSYIDYMVKPFLLEAATRVPGEANQSLSALFQRLFTDAIAVHFRDGSVARINWLALDADTARWTLRALIALGLVGLGLLCRTPIVDRRDWRLAVEFSLLLIAMLFVSPRSWKHHYVVMALPYACLIAAAAHARSRVIRNAVLACIAASCLLVLSTSRDLAGPLSATGEGHEIALAYGAFLWSAAIVLAALAALLLRARGAGALSAR